MKIARSIYYYCIRRTAAEKIVLRNRVVALCEEIRATAIGGSRRS
jgi:hypothetical protein